MLQNQINEKKKKNNSKTKFNNIKFINIFIKIFINIFINIFIDDFISIFIIVIIKNFFINVGNELG
jgi:hypothetical protein